MGGTGILHRDALIIAMVVLAAFIGCAEGGTINIVGVQGTWEVSGIACTDCEGRKPVEVGTILELGEASIRNPLYGDCKARPGYSLINQVSSKDLLSKSGIAWPVGIQQISKKQTTVLYGFVTCDGINYMQVLFFSPHNAAYFYEGGLVFLLSRRGK